MLFYAFIFLFLNIVNSNYFYNRSIKTPFSTTEELIDFFETPSFFNKYLTIIKAQDVIYCPEVIDKFSYPQIISYKFIPDIPSIPSFLIRKTKIKHEWNKNNDILCGIITSDYATFNISLYPSINNHEIFFNLNGTIIKKLVFVPNKIIDILMTQFCNIFCKILNN